jgi:uncharacterized protein YbaR (Trm112 family)
MEIVKGICPNCKKPLVFKVNDPKAMANKLIACPNCHSQSKLLVYMHGTIEKSGDSSSEEVTQLNFASAPKQINKTIGVLYSGGLQFHLKMGTNRIGRKTDTNTADIQIDDPNRYMSRDHATITVRSTPNGIEHLFAVTNPKNPTKINGNIIEDEDMIILKWGDEIILGKTEVLFERPNNDDEQTVLL